MEQKKNSESFLFSGSEQVIRLTKKIYPKKEVLRWRIFYKNYCRSTLLPKAFSRKDSFGALKELMDGQKNHYKENERIDSWVLFFMECLITLTQRLEAKYRRTAN